VHWCVDGDLHAKGLKLQGTDVSLSATRDITLEAAANTSEVHSSNSGHNYGGGVTVGFGQQNGVSFQLSAGQNAGKANGTETTYDNTLIEASNSLKITSGRDTTLSGAQLKGKQVDANIGGNLTVTTLQDSSQYESKQSSSGLSISLCIPPICYGQTVSGNVQLTRDTINHNYQSAVGQSGIFAGDSGFNIIVSGNTLLKGGALASDNFAPEAFKSETVPSLSGALIDRATDSEARILNNIAMKLGDNTEIKGGINLFTERPPCGSCSNVINLFKDKYKNITVNVYDNNGKTIPPIKKF
jgi:filamentous hemagglutinin